MAANQKKVVVKKSGVAKSEEKTEVKNKGENGGASVVESGVDSSVVVDTGSVQSGQGNDGSDIANEGKRLELESEQVKLQERLKEIRKELRALSGKTKREGPTKMDRAVELWKAEPGLQRKDYIAKFQSELGLTLAGAKTYIQIIMKKNKPAEPVVS